MFEDEDQMRSIISYGWAGMLALLLVMVVSDYSAYGILGNFSPLPIAPGTLGLFFLIILIGFNVLMQISVKTFDFMAFRWLVFGVTWIYAAFFLWHQFVHFSFGGGVDLHFFIDMSHHMISGSASLIALKWALVSSSVSSAGHPTFTLLKG